MSFVTHKLLVTCQCAERGAELGSSHALTGVCPPWQGSAARFSTCIFLALVAAGRWMGCCVIASFIFSSDVVTYLCSLSGAV